MRIKILLFALLSSVLCNAQSYISYDYISSSTLKDDDGNKHGEGAASIVSGKIDMPLYYKVNEEKRPIMWLASLSAKYADFYNDINSPKTLQPDDIINSSINITHIRPLNKKWDVIASLGGGVYADHKHISWESVLGNGGVFFVYNYSPTFKFGFGGGLTNSYGLPMLLPMVYVKWQKNGKYELKIDFSGNLKIVGSTKLNEKLKLELTAIEMEGLSAVYETKEGTKIFSSTIYKSSFAPIYEIDKHFSAYIGIGANWRRTANVKDRKIKDMFNLNHSGDRHFGSAFRISAGIRYKLK